MASETAVPVDADNGISGHAAPSTSAARWWQMAGSTSVGLFHVRPVAGNVLLATGSARPTGSYYPDKLAAPYRCAGPAYVATVAFNDLCAGCTATPTGRQKHKVPGRFCYTRSHHLMSRWPAGFLMSDFGIDRTAGGSAAVFEAPQMRTVTYSGVNRRRGHRRDNLDRRQKCGFELDKPDRRSPRTPCGR